MPGKVTAKADGSSFETIAAEMERSSDQRLRALDRAGAINVTQGHRGAAA